MNETAEQIVRHSAFNGESFFVGLAINDGGRNPTHTRIVISDIRQDQAGALTDKYGGKFYPKEMRKPIASWVLGWAEPRRLQSIHGILPLLIGTQKLGWALQAIAQEEGVPLDKYLQYFWANHKHDWSWVAYRHWKKLHPHLGE